MALKQTFLVYALAEPCNWNLVDFDQVVSGHTKILAISRHSKLVNMRSWRVNCYLHRWQSRIDIPKLDLVIVPCCDKENLVFGLVCGVGLGG